MVAKIFNKLVMANVAKIMDSENSRLEIMELCKTLAAANNPLLTAAEYTFMANEDKAWLVWEELMEWHSQR